MKRFFAVPVAVLLFACGSTNDFDPSVTNAVGTVSDTAKPASIDPALQQPAIITSQPVGTTPVNVSTTPVINAAVQQPVTASPATATTAKGMNPAHGQPGHRCDIAVGAPLNSAPQQATPAAQQSKPQEMIVKPSVTTSPPATKVAPGMNPEHGQPGHRCDIAVGAPLNSPKASAPAQATPVISPVPSSATPIPAPVIKPAADSSKN